LEPFVMSLKRLGLLEVQFLIPGAFEFRGLQDFHNDSVNVTLNRGGISYAYTVELIKNDFGSLDLPKPRNNRALLWVVLVIIAAIAAAVAYWVSVRYVKSRTA
jgi:hypothetical protein